MNTGWRPRSVRVRLTLWYSAALAGILLLYAAGVFLFVRNSLRDQLDRQLHDDFETAEEMVERTSSGEFRWRASRHHESGEDRFLELWNQDGRPLLRLPDSPVAPQNLGPPVPPRARYEYVSVEVADGSYVRTLTGSFPSDRSPLILRVARSENGVRHELGELLLVLALGFPLATGVAGAGGYLLARRALAPVDRMADQARSITADRLRERLPVENPDDELGRLATVFNETLARLEEAFDRLKRFTSDASHELRTPLTAIRSVGEVGLRERRDENAYRDIIGSMLEEVDRLTRLVNSLLTLSRADAGQARPRVERIDLTSLAREVGAHLGVLAEEKGQSIHVEGDPVCGRADRILLRGALINLVDNAIKYSPHGARVSIIVSESPEAYAIAVSDIGPGIAPEHQPLVFDRFYRVDHGRSRDRGGAGLGLAIARWAVQAHGGRIELESREGEGSIFRIVLPHPT